MVKAVIFDIGNVLLPLPQAQMDADIANVLGITLHLLDPILEKYMNRLQRGEMTELEYWTAIADDLGKPVPACYDELWSREFRKHAKKDPQMEGLVKRLRDTGLKIGLLSNTEASHSALLRQWFPEEEYDGYVLSNEVGMVKPDRKIYAHAINQLEVKPNEAVFIDDRLKNVQGAAYAGLKTVHFRSYEQVVRELKAWVNQGREDPIKLD